MAKRKRTKKDDAADLIEPEAVRLEPDPHALHTEAVHIVNDASYYQRLLDEAEHAANEAARTRKRVRAETYLDIKNNGTQYGLDKDKVSAADAVAVLDAAAAVDEAEKQLNAALFRRDHYRGVISDLNRKERSIKKLQEQWQGGYFEGPTGMPLDFENNGRHSYLEQLESLTARRVRNRHHDAEEE